MKCLLEEFACFLLSEVSQYNSPHPGVKSQLSSKDIKSMSIEKSISKSKIDLKSPFAMLPCIGPHHSDIDSLNHLESVLKSEIQPTSDINFLENIYFITPSSAVSTKMDNSSFSSVRTSEEIQLIKVYFNYAVGIFIDLDGDSFVSDSHNLVEFIQLLIDLLISSLTMLDMKSIIRMMHVSRSFYTSSKHAICLKIQLAMKEAEMKIVTFNRHGTKWFHFLNPSMTADGNYGRYTITNASSSMISQKLR